MTVAPVPYIICNKQYYGKKYRSIVLNIPHSGTDGLPGKWNNPAQLTEEVDKWTDWHTDYMSSSDDNAVSSVIAKLSRFIVDTERLLDDPLASVGQGILYTSFNGLSRVLTDAEQEELMSCYYSHIEALRVKINEDTLLIDCHSFPSYMSDVDICIGFNEDWSKPSESLLDSVVEHYERNGYKVGINTPFSNAISPDTGFRYHSFMIELNKRIYLNESDQTLNASAYNVKSIINESYRILLDFRI